MVYIIRVQNSVETVHKCDIYCFFDKLRQNYASFPLAISGEVFSSAKSDTNYTIKGNMVQEKMGIILIVCAFKSQKMNKYSKSHPHCL